MGRSVVFDVLAIAKATGFEDSARKMNSLADSADRSSKSFDRQTKQTHLLSTGLLSLGAAAVPVAGVAAGALIGLGAAAGVALVGVLGIRDAMKQGTPLGRQYEAAFKPLVSEFASLKQIGAAGLFKGINQGVKGLQPLFPTINRDVALFSGQLGIVIGHVGPAFAALFTRVNPLFATFGDQLVHGSAAFQHWAQTSTSVGKFVAYVQTSLPQVEQTIGSLVTTISHVVIAAEPFGGTTLTAIRLFSTAINAIPLGVLQTIVPLLLGLKVGNTLSNSISNASTGLAGFAKKLTVSGDGASGAGRAVSGLGKAVGYLGPVGIVAGLALGGLSVVMGHSKQSAIADAARVNDLTQAIQNQTTATTILSQLQASGAVKAGKELGLSQQTLVQAVLEHGAALDTVKAKIASANTQYQGMNTNLVHLSATQAQVNDPKGFQAAVDARNNLYNSLVNLSKGLRQEQADYDKAKAKAAQWATQQGDAALAAKVSSGAFAATSKQLGVTGDAYINAQLAVDKQAQATAASTLQMRLANDAAGLLKQSLDALNGKELSVGQATTSYDQSLLSLTKSLQTNGRTIADNTDKGVANRQAIEGAVSAAQQQAQAIADATKSTVAGTKAYDDNGKAILARIAKQNGDVTATQRANDKTYQYAQQLLGLGRIKVPPTKVDLDKAAADKKISDFKRSLIQIPGYRPTAVVNASTNRALAQLKNYKDHLLDLNGRTATTFVDVVTYQTNSANKRAGMPPIRDSGGPVVKGTSYLIGLNRRPEVFTAGESGHITPIGDSSGARALGGATINLTIQAGAIANPVEFRRLLIAELEQAFAAGGTVAGGQKAMR